MGIGISLLCVLIGFGPGLVAGRSHAVHYVVLLAPLTNALGHWHGRQNLENTAYNWRLFAWVSGGESVHNNHHAHPRSAKFSVRRAGFDPSWPGSRTLAAMRRLVIVGLPDAWAPVSEPQGAPFGGVPTRTAG